jgi:heat shock protein HtpX
MALAKRIVLFLLVNILVVSFISFISYFFNLQPFLQKNGLNLTSLAIFCTIWGMAGALISLFLSKVMAKWMMGLKIIDPNTNDPQQRAVIDIVYGLAKKAGLPKMPEVAIYQSPELNAFATGPSRSNSLVAVSTGLLQRMNKSEIDAVIGHEITHVANGDMVTMTLLQGVINAFVMFLARIIAYGINKFFMKSDDREGGSSFIYYITVFVLEIVFMILGSLVVAAFSRRREYRADAGGARLAGTQAMISALEALKRNLQINDPNQKHEAINAFKISGGKGSFMQLFSTHPALDDRIARLQKLGSR